MGTFNSIKRGFNEGYLVAKNSPPFMVDFVKSVNPGKSVYSKAVRVGIRYAEMNKKLERMKKTRSLSNSKTHKHEHRR